MWETLPRRRIVRGGSSTEREPCFSGEQQEETVSHKTETQKHDFREIVEGRWKTKESEGEGPSIEELNELKRVSSPDRY